MDEIFIGLMSGTSLDGADGVIVEFGGAPGSVRTLAHRHRVFSPKLSQELLALNTPGDNELHRASLAANAIAATYSDVVEALLADSGVHRDRVVAIGAHGQTVRHRPGEFDGVGYTTQLNSPSLLAELTGIPVIADFRARDVAAGGQGAPLVPAFHRAVFGGGAGHMAVLNIGGISNLTSIGLGESTVGFDCGPGNVLLDHWSQLNTGSPFDDQGAWAATGSVVETLLTKMLEAPYFSRRPPKSTGRDLFNPEWLNSHLQAHLAICGTPAAPLPADIQATLAELTARSCAAAVLEHAQDAKELLVCGGGSLNTDLMSRLSARLPNMRVMTTDDRGLPAMQVEACAFAWLARAWMVGESGNICQVTGARGPRILGALYPAGQSAGPTKRPP